MKSIHILKAALSSALLLGSVAHARPTSEWSYVGAFDQGFDAELGFDQRFDRSEGFKGRFDARAWSAEGSAAGGLTLGAQTASVSAATSADTNNVFATASSDNGRAHAMSVTNSYGLSAVTGSSLETTLFNFIANVRAQQFGNHFDLLQTGVASIGYTLQTPVSAVPLPAAAWLFAAGMLGLCGSRLRVGGQTRRTSGGLAVSAAS